MESVRMPRGIGAVSSQRRTLIALAIMFVGAECGLYRNPIWSRRERHRPRVRLADGVQLARRYARRLRRARRGHHLIALGDAGGFRAGTTAWALWQLKGDTTAGNQFIGASCGLCNIRTWSRYMANAALR